jgi:hypothetical protein
MLAVDEDQAPRGARSETLPLLHPCEGSSNGLTAPIHAKEPRPRRDECALSVIVGCGSAVLHKAARQRRAGQSAAIVDKRHNVDPVARPSDRPAARSGSTMSHVAADTELRQRGYPTR